MTKEEAVERFADEWEIASSLTPNLKWAIFPTGNKDIELQAATHLMALFNNVTGFVYLKDPTADHSKVIASLEELLADYKEKAGVELAAAAEENDYKLHIGS